MQRRSWFQFRSRCQRQENRIKRRSENQPEAQVLRLHIFRSREAAAADSRGRKPTELRPKQDPKAAKRRQQAVTQIAVAASRLACSFGVLLCGLTPAAIQLQSLLRQSSSQFPLS
jgi:hypothetical protein